MVDDMRRAFRMRRHGRAGMLGLQLQQFRLAERLMHDADARPEQHVAAELALQIAAQMLVGAEDDLLLPWDLRQIFSAEEEVTMMSESAFTSAEQLM